MMHELQSMDGAKWSMVKQSHIMGVVGSQNFRKSEKPDIQKILMGKVHEFDMVEGAMADDTME